MEPLANILKDCNTRLVFISTSSKEQTEQFVEQAPINIVGEVYSDPDRALHKLFHLKRGVFRTLASAIPSTAKTYGMKGIIEGIIVGVESGVPGGIQGSNVSK